MELSFGEDNAAVFSGPLSSAVSVSLVTKNVPLLLVKVFELHPWNLLKATGQQVSGDVDLEGLCPAWELAMQLAEPPVRRYRTACPATTTQVPYYIY